MIYKPWVSLKIIFLLVSLIVLFFLVAKLYLNKTIVIESPKKDEPGEKIIIVLPSGKEVYTYENLIQSENGKLYYKGDRSEIDLTGGIVKYEDWE
jgi:capsular polysaccharide biosynthesis protein